MVKELFSNVCERFHLYERLPADVETGDEQDGGECSEDQSRDKISSSNAFWNICNSIQGVAILAMPYVIKGGGWWSIVALVIVAAISNYTGQILIKCHYDEMENEEDGSTTIVRTRTSYAEVGEAIWPQYGRRIILLVQVLELLFMATLYPIVSVSVLHILFPVKIFPSGVWILVFGLIVYPNVFLKKLYHISLMSTVTVVSAAFVTAVIIMYCFTSVATWKVGQMSIISAKEFISAIGVIIASYSSQMYLSVIEASMREPQKVGTVMNLGYTAMTLLKIGIGVVAYMTFGDSTLQVVALNLPPGVLLTMVNIVVLFLALSSYTLPMFTAFEILENDSSITESTGDVDKGMKRRVLVRTGLVLVTLLMAISVPHFCLVLSFIGCFTGCFLEIIFPCAFYCILKWDKINTFELVFNILLIVGSLLFMGIGMYFSGLAMVHAFKYNTKEVWSVD
ncbi:vesicular inhibitory amino acid transporter-like [Clytia hemisphaerica]|uniref:Amino acid transporter transmembrane domain-containing protein n=1 Tax=Clytia hemisphaerica TaxID=252671 RepID=A0A7M5WM61_9CNID